jgi:hypothetical protein
VSTVYIEDSSLLHYKLRHQRNRAITRKSRTHTQTHTHNTHTQRGTLSPLTCSVLFILVAELLIMESLACWPYGRKVYAFNMGLQVELTN